MDFVIPENKTKGMLEEIITLRRHLHQNPDLSGKEAGTSKIIQEFAKSHSEVEIVSDLGGAGLALIYSFPEEGPTVMIRCELDALPIEEPNQFSHRSLKKGISHKCGHDGHMAIVAGILPWIKTQAIKKGRIILLFQPAEETGKGALQILKDVKFKALKPDYIFALHNLPGEPLNSIITVEDAFSCTVLSFSIQLTGKQSHASEPENGINPAVAISRIITGLNDFRIPDENNPEFALLTPVYLNMGDKAYGISAGKGELHYTIRTRSEEAMEVLKKKILNLVGSICTDEKLKFNIQWFDHFLATVNHAKCNEIIKEAAIKNDYQLITKPHPFKFGEDFGWFSQHTKAAMFGLGAGINVPALHHNDYDFPDEILQTGIDMFTSIIQKILNSSEEP